ncbi:MAG: hypothetical protein PW734_06575 [Verrucomicrobium sp.]|nr:hypothetical protein [Verrucomicrobium sp.]
MNKTARLVFLSLAAVMAVAALAVAAGYVWINRYLGSSDFRERVSQAASRALGVEGRFEGLRWSGFSLYSPSFSAAGGPGSAVDRLLVQDIRAGLSLAAAFRGVWKVDEIEVGRLHLSLKKADAGKAVTPAEVPLPESAGRSLLPSKFQVDRLQFHSVTVAWPAELAGGGSASDVAVEVRHEEEGWRVDGKKGTLALAALPVQEVQKVSLRIRPGRLYLTEAALKNPGQGTLSLSGEAGIGDASDVDLRGEVSGVPVTPFLPPDWRARFYGNLFSFWRFTSPRLGDGPWRLEGQAHLEEARLEGLPILDQFAAFTRTAAYRTLKFRAFSFDYALVPGQADVKDLEIESEGLARAEGAISCSFSAGNALDGQVQLGLPASTLSALPGAQSQVFTESRGLYFWAPVHVGGTLDQPTEDLSPRLTTAVRQAVEQKVKQGVESAVDLFRRLIH